MSMREYYEAYWLRREPSPLTDPLTPTRLALLRAVLGSNGRRILDVGCGAGTIAGELGRDGYEAVGFDISQRAVETARARYPSSRFEQHSVEDLPWPIEARSQDAVVAFEVIEHLVQPRRLLAGAREALRPGGHFALTTPYHGFLKNLAISLVAFEKHFDVEGEHVRFFTDNALRRLVTETGFTVERITHFGRIAGVWAGVFVWARRR